MTDFGAQVRAAIQQVRDQTRPECDGLCRMFDHSSACDERWAAQFDARLAVCVEAMMEAAIGAPEGRRVHAYTLRESGLAAFLAAAAQKETAK